MKKSYFIAFAFSLILNFSFAQNTAMQFNGLDCNDNAIDLFADLDAGKAVILHFFMPNCGSCIPVAQKMQAMSQTINSSYPGMVKGYAFPFQNSTTCSYTSTWVSSNNLSTLYAPVDSGATQVAYYGGFGMPTVVVLGGLDHQVLFTTQSFVTSDTTTIKEAILNMFQNANGLNDINMTGDKFQLFPNPANEFLNIGTIEKGISSLHVDITDITGKNVMSFSNDNFTISSIDKLNTSQLNNGNYFVNINLNGQSHIRNLMVIH
jgi:thiol-disulfide isomerase/thioredoxin